MHHRSVILGRRGRITCLHRVGSATTLNPAECATVTAEIAGSRVQGHECPSPRASVCGVVPRLEPLYPGGDRQAAQRVQRGYGSCQRHERWGGKESCAASAASITREAGNRFLRRSSTTWWD